MTVNGSAPQALTSTGINIDILAFYISPQSDPFAADPGSGLYASNLQPTVTVAVQARTVGIGASDVLTVNAETTAASRLYER